MKTKKNSKLKTKQLELLQSQSKSYGGELLKTRSGRSHGRPLDTKNTMHLVLRSSQAKGTWSFRIPKNSVKIKEIVDKFSKKYRIQILSIANVGNHLHFQIRLFNRNTYKPFIRAITSAIAMAVTGVNRWNTLKLDKGGKGLSTELDSSLRSIKTAGLRKLKFWDYRPFTRVVTSFKAFLNLKDYILINELEGYGVKREQARLIIGQEGRDWAHRFLFARV